MNFSSVYYQMTTDSRNQNIIESIEVTTVEQKVDFLLKTKIKMSMMRDKK